MKMNKEKVFDILMITITFILVVAYLIFRTWLADKVGQGMESGEWHWWYLLAARRFMP